MPRFIEWGMLTDLLILAPAAAVFLILIVFRKRPKVVAPVADGPPANAIVIDGSNVMYWGDGNPSLKVLSKVLRNIEARGLHPIVFFDASVGYRVGDRYYSEEILAPLIGVTSEHICVVSKGVIADESLLMFATDYKLRVVTNDRYRDWAARFPLVRDKKRMVRGDAKGGKVVWHGKAWG